MVFVFFPMDELTLDDMTFILSADMDVGMSNERHMAYDKPLILTIK